MKRKMFLSMYAAILTICGVVVLTGCKHDMSDYMPKPYSTTDSDRLKYAEEKLGVTIDPQQDSSDVIRIWPRRWLSCKTI